jgi:hypothetical protein
MANGPVNLFVYGSLKSPLAFRAVTGLTFQVEGEAKPIYAGDRALAALPAWLDDFELVSPDDLYVYAVQSAKPSRAIEGLLVRDVPADALTLLAQYEGPHYERRSVAARTARGAEPAEAFVSPPGRLHATLAEFSPADRPRNLKAEFAFRARIDHLLAGGEGEPAGDLRPQPLKVRALREVRGPAVYDQIRAHFQVPGLSDFFVRQALSGPVPSFEPLRTDSDAALFAENYVALLVRQVIFNQIERRIFDLFRYEIQQVRGSDRFFERAVSELAALRILVDQSPVLAAVAGDAVTELDYRRNEFMDYVQWAILAADHLFEPAMAREAIGWIAANRAGGLVPLSARLEFSNLPDTAEASSERDGARPHHMAAGFDPALDGLRYFRAFGLNSLTWKLGGYVQPRSTASERGGLRGSLILALGSTGWRELARPVSADPWLINQLIHHILRFYEVRPRGLTLTLHLPPRLATGRPPGKCGPGRTLPEPIIRCLLALSGDVAADRAGPGGSVKIRRISQRQIVSIVPTRELDLLRVMLPERPAGSADRAGLSGPNPPGSGDRPADRASRLARAEYRFPQLSPQIDYVPLILAIKGVQLRYRPTDFLTHKQMQAEPELAGLFNALLEWADHPAPIELADRAMFLDAVAAGLASEHHDRPAHSPQTIAEALAALGQQLDQFNRLVTARPQST